MHAIFNLVQCPLRPHFQIVNRNKAGSTDFINQVHNDWNHGPAKMNFIFVHNTVIIWGAISHIHVRSTKCCNTSDDSICLVYQWSHFPTLFRGIIDYWSNQTKIKANFRHKWLIRRWWEMGAICQELGVLWLFQHSYMEHTCIINKVVSGICMGT